MGEPFRSLILSIAMLAGVASGVPQGTAPSPELTEQYAIYSLVLQNPATSHGPYKADVYLIGDTTLLLYGNEPDRSEQCLKVPKEYEKTFGQVLDDYQSRKDIRTKLQRLFKISKPYELLKPQEVEQFMRIHSNPVPGPNLTGQDRLSTTTDVILLSSVYFDQSHRLAMMAFTTYCGPLCGASTWRIFEKMQNGQWEERPWVTCKTFS